MASSFKLLVLALALLLGACSTFVPAAGPRTQAIVSSPTSAELHGIELIHVDYTVAHRLEQEQASHAFSAYFSGPAHPDHRVGAGDVLQVYIWEAPPAMLFNAQGIASSGVTIGSNGMVSLPPQMISSEGDIRVPFIGRLQVAGLTTEQVAVRITRYLRGKANEPQVLVSLLQNNTQNVTVVGNVQHSMEVPLNPGGVSLLRALALAGGVTKPVEKTSIQLSRSGRVMTMPLQAVLRDPADNIALHAGDVVTALYQPESFTVLGATGRNAEVPFEASGITLAQALARAGGVDDGRANPAGVFLFRFEAPAALPWSSAPRLVDGKVPTIFQFNLRDPSTFFAAQTFPVQNHDLLYVTDSPATDLQKVLNVVGGIVYPFQTLNAMGVIK
ncbi:polysaccharide biosynthesis/export protein [mine drainage metagenome]|jgi:polysaccharide export outer membrane protein|uniref:Polysaccharide biosynthesis/export protein n=1 Tax=mine drainage metagenome TaxID=410659 RepID=A0A1J5QIQ6_9ZZZZ